MSEFMREIERANFSMFLQKSIRQRGEHSASALKRHPKMYGYIFIHLHKWDSIPSHFMEVKRVIERKGPCIDRQIGGTYCLTLHGHHSCGDAEKVRYLAGCKLLVSVTKGIQVREVRCQVPPFKWLISTARIYDKSGEKIENEMDLSKRRKKRQIEDDGSYSVI